jgi:hypothetical protein
MGANRIKKTDGDVRIPKWTKMELCRTGVLRPKAENPKGTASAVRESEGTEGKILMENSL